MAELTRPRRVVVVGGGIVGAAVAAELSVGGTVDVTVVERGPQNRLLGPANAVDGLWVAEALWVTHAAGAAQALARMMRDAPPTIDGRDALRPGRFAGRRPDELTASALRRYRDIYATA